MASVAFEGATFAVGVVLVAVMAVKVVVTFPVEPESVDVVELLVSEGLVVAATAAAVSVTLTSSSSLNLKRTREGAPSDGGKRTTTR